MNETPSLLPAPTSRQDGGSLVPTALSNAPACAVETFFEFFTATIPNANTRDGYLRDVARFFAWCEERRFDPMTATPIHLAGYCETLKLDLSPARVKRHFSALGILYA